MDPVAPVEQDPLFSIVTVCRNAEQSLGATVESVLNQEPFGGALEHLIIDGASTDGTLAVAGRYSHLRVLSEPDAGIYDAMNKGVGLARGKYIAILNADDWYEADALRVVAETFRQWPDATLVHGDIRRWRGTTALDVVKPPHDTGSRRRVLMPVNHPACFARKDAFIRFGRFDTTYRIFADFDWVSRVIRGGVLTRYCPRVLTNFRIGGVSTIRCAVCERYRVFRSNGIGRVSAAAAVVYACAGVLRNRLGADRVA